ncbi:MAG: UvrABC system protein C [Candidatus Omnitrophica bacterium]|nr:UvrABC system protein C [Candidatus Omnitrophota bacterium]
MARLIPEALKARIAELPETPGVYLFRSREGEVLYVGKAVSIRRRVSGHFRYYGETFSKEGVMLSRTTRIDHLETAGEAEALLLESSLVKQLRPKYNQELKDDKSYPFLKITAEKYPRLLIVRRRKADGATYFGPYTSAFLLRQAVERLRREFPLRTCRTLPKKVCLMYHIGQCGGPCEGKVADEQYARIVRELTAFLEGRRDALVRTLSRRMKEHSAAREYEQARAIHQEIQALSSVPSPDTLRRDPEPALRVLASALGLKEPPRRIEGFDISNIQGQEPVGSMVVLIDGKPARSEYRKYKIRTVSGIDDFAMMNEVVGRRYARLLEEGSPLPDLVLIDGGKGQLSAAGAALKKLGLEGRLPLVSIAKQHEHLFLPGRETPVVLSLSSPALKLLLVLRNEAHRFAITFHRGLHRKAQLGSALEAVPGVGPATRRRILSVLSPAALSRTTPEELARRTGVSRALALRITRAMAGRSAEGAS